MWSRTDVLDELVASIVGDPGNARHGLLQQDPGFHLPDCWQRDSNRCRRPGFECHSPTSSLEESLIYNLVQIDIGHFHWTVGAMRNSEMPAYWAFPQCLQFRQSCSYFGHIPLRAISCLIVVTCVKCLTA